MRVCVMSSTLFALVVLSACTAIVDEFETKRWNPPPSEVHARSIAVCMDQSTSVPKAVQKEELDQTLTWLREAADPFANLTATDKVGNRASIDVGMLRRSLGGDGGYTDAMRDSDRDIAFKNLKEVGEVRMYLRSIRENAGAQGLLLDQPLTVPHVRPKGAKPREKDKEIDRPPLYPDHLREWRSDMQDAEREYRSAGRALDDVRVPEKSATDSDYFACIGAAARDIKDYPWKTLLLVGDLILDQNQDALRGRELDGVDVVLYSDCSRSTVFDSGGHLAGVPRNQRCGEVEEKWATCFATWGARSVEIVRRGDPNPLVRSNVGGTSRATSGACRIREEIPKPAGP